MTATNTTLTAKDGAGSTFNIAQASESVSTAKASATYLKSPSTEALVEPFVAGQAIGALVAGSAIIGKVGIDQTTDGTTNLVSAKQNGTWNVGTITTLPALVAGSAIIGNVRIDQTTDGTTNAVSAKQNGTWNIGTITTLPALVAGAALIGKVGIDQTTPGTTNAVVLTATTIGGTLTYAALGGTGNALLTNSAITVVSGAHSLYKVRLTNSGAAGVWVQLFDASSVTLGTTVPKDSIWVPPNGVWVDDFDGEARVGFSTGIMAAATATSTGNGAPTATIAATFYYK